jgi:hypothetical protein
VAPQALKLAFAQIEGLRDPSLYQTAMNAYDAVADLPESQLPPISEVCQVNTAWCEGVVKKNQTERTKLEVELKTYSNNMIKESIRVRPVPWISDRTINQLSIRWVTETSVTSTAPLEIIPKHSNIIRNQESSAQPVSMSLICVYLS